MSEQQSGPDEPARVDPGAAAPAAGTADGGPDATDAGPAPAANGSSPFDEIASWVPPWARSLPELVIEPAADDPPDEPLWFGGGSILDPEVRRDKVAEAPAEPEPAVDIDPADFVPGLSDEALRGALESILLVVDEPVPVVTLAHALEEPTGRIEATLRTLAAEYTASGRGFDLRQLAGGWRYYTRAEFADYVERFVLDGQQVRLTQAALETLAVVAYKQPVTRSRVSAVRGVNCDGVMKTLLTRGLVEECGTEPESGAHLYRTTRLFLEKVGINSVADLPSLGPLLPDSLDEIDFAHR